MNRPGAAAAAEEDSYVWVRANVLEQAVRLGQQQQQGYYEWDATKWQRQHPRISHGRRRSETNGSSNNDWGWILARVVHHQQHHRHQQLLATPPRGTNSADADNNKTPENNSPFGHVKLRKVKTNSPAVSTATNNRTPPKSKAPRRTPAVPVQTTVTITTLAGNGLFGAEEGRVDRSHLANITVCLTYTTTAGGGDEEDENENPATASIVCKANHWWQQQHQDVERNAPHDLCQLEHLHEPAVLYCLQQRYAQEAIYTYTGKILLALNPCRRLPRDDSVAALLEYYYSDYSNSGPASPSKPTTPRSTTASVAIGNLPPHVYALAQDAYRSMMEALMEEQEASYDQRRQGQGGSNNPSDAETSKNQSILVSGESGAGKTVTTKIILKYLATVSEQRGGGSSGQVSTSHPRRSAAAQDPSPAVATIESQVLQSNPILEAFGNARTIRNDNSSRFGKLIELQFTETGCLVSALLETYLLEKVRLLSQAPGERNYHIFYQVLAGLPQKDRRDLCISNSTARDFKITAVSGTFDRRRSASGTSHSGRRRLSGGVTPASTTVDTADDKQQFQELQTAFDTVGFTRKEQTDLLTVVCALLHTSNLTFKESSTATPFSPSGVAGDACELDRFSPSLKSVVSLLGVDVDALNSALCQVAIEARGETLYKQLSVERAEKALEALMKTTYGALFDYIVRRINSFMTKSENEDVEDGQRPHMASISVLDIFGFESLENNSFEQLCINFCNEALQQQFNRFVFKLEQHEYEKEGIEWSFISFPDNQDVLDLIQKRHDGILSILDEQCRLPRCTDKTFALAMYMKCREHARFEATKAQEADLTFSVQHYAGLVEYDTDGFIEKNKDELPKETTELLLSSSNPFLVNLGRDLSTFSTSSRQQKPSPLPSRKALRRSSSSILRDSVGTQFTHQLHELGSKIETTTPHYVRCLKPNDELAPYTFDSMIIADQLRCAGVLEAIRVSRVGFPNRYYHDHFVRRYSVLARREILRYGQRETGQELCEVLMDVLTPELSKVLQEQSDTNNEDLISIHGSGGKRPVFLGMQMGRTKVFLQRRAFEALEYLRSRKINMAATTIQSITRMFFARTRFEIAVYAAIIIQNLVRRVGAYRLAQAERYYRAANSIQRAWRCFRPRRRLRAAQLIAWWCQSTRRGIVAREYCAYLFLDTKAAKIQRFWKRNKLRRTFQRVRSAVVTLQNLQRARTAKRELLELRRSAKDLSSVAAERDRFRQESLRLRRELELATQSPPAKTKSPERKAEEIEKLRHEVQRLRVELDKAHRFMSPSVSMDDDMQSLIEECNRKEEQLNDLRAELDSVRRTVLPGSPMLHGSPASGTGSGGRLHRASPVRSDVSLLDTDEDEDSALTDDAIPFITKCQHHGSDLFASPDAHTSVDTEDLRNLHLSIQHGNAQLFDQILRKSGDPISLVNQGDKYGRASLHLASLAFNLQLAEALIGNGAVANAQDDDGETPLHLAENASMVELLLTKGHANPNIPNIDGICALHLAVQRRDIDSVRALLRAGANVNNADNIRWFTPLHLICLPATHESLENPEDDLRSRIAQLLTGTYDGNEPDMNYQDSEGNTPLHYATQLDTPEACSLIDVFLEKDADPNICNGRNQTPLHLLCHNEGLRGLDVFQEALHSMLFHGADPNVQSLTGCTPLHLSLYHRDVDSAVQLVNNGAELHLLWRKPSRWTSFWEDMGVSEVLALDMVEDDSSLHRIVAAINGPQKWAPSRSWCMHCKAILGTYAQAMHCRHCSRLVCGNCAPSCLPVENFPKSFNVTEPSFVCVVCEKILATRLQEDLSNGTHPTSSYGEDEDDRYSC